MLTFDPADYPAGSALVTQRVSMRSLTTGAGPDANPQYNGIFDRETITTGNPITRATAVMGGTLARVAVPIPNLPAFPADGGNVPRRCVLLNNAVNGGAGVYCTVVIPFFLQPRSSLVRPISPISPLTWVSVAMALPPNGTLTFATWQICNPGSSRLPTGTVWIPPYLLAMDTPADPAPNMLDTFLAGPVIGSPAVIPAQTEHPIISVDVIYY